jgi:signal peptidase II
LKKTAIVSLVILAVLILDQLLKIWVKTNMYYGETFGILGLQWAQIHFVENEGAAFGLKYGGDTGKLILSVFRIFMVSFLIYMIRKMIQSKEPVGFLIFFSLIIAGAIGNIIDSIFYGVIFSESLTHGQNVAELFPEGGGYAKVFYGKVVDMLYFPLFEFRMPNWFPLWGGEQMKFFRFVFNIADSAISVGVAGILLFYRKYFTRPANPSKESAPIVAAVSGEKQDDSKGEEE